MAKKKSSPLIEKYKRLKQELKKAKEELEIQSWGLRKTNQAIKLLYKELAEKNKRLEELDRLKSDFISTVSHELRTPLSIIKEGISLVLDGIVGKVNARQQKVLITARENIDRLERIINNLLDISKIEAGKVELSKESINIKSLIQKLIFSFAPKVKDKGLELKVNLPKKEISIYADADRVIQALTNLIYNAIKFTNQGSIEILVKEKSDAIECSVTDTGRGISKDGLARVFGKFQQFGRAAGPGEKGTGLGLAITKSIVEMHNGEIWVESPPAERSTGLTQGTKFTFTLPKLPAEVEDE